jgi:hypothetical protein
LAVGIEGFDLKIIPGSLCQHWTDGQKLKKRFYPFHKWANLAVLPSVFSATRKGKDFEPCHTVNPALGVAFFWFGRCVTDLRRAETGIRSRMHGMVGEVFAEFNFAHGRSL